jgi:ubiquinone/menaquinone biosynthesis C-methylase UbiE
LTTLDPKQYKEAERQKWDNVANGWQKWWNRIERGAGKLSKRLIELAEIKPGSRVLDISTGIGEPAITAASQMAKTGHILATADSSIIFNEQVLSSTYQATLLHLF